MWADKTRSSNLILADPWPVEEVGSSHSGKFAIDHWFYLNRVLNSREIFIIMVLSPAGRDWKTT